jgi:hypothetical protein
MRLIGIIYFESSTADGIVANMRVSDTDEWVKVFKEVAKALVFDLAERALRVNNPCDKQLLEFLSAKDSFRFRG